MNLYCINDPGNPEKGIRAEYILTNTSATKSSGVAVIQYDSQEFVTRSVQIIPPKHDYVSGFFDFINPNSLVTHQVANADGFFLNVYGGTGPAFSAELMCDPGTGQHYGPALTFLPAQS